MTNPTDRLCTRCGLCCDGSLFAEVELSSEREATRLEVLRLEVEEDGDGPLLLQPCRALRGTRCSVYAHRPQCCQSFECRLLQDVRRGALPADRAAAIVAAARAQVARVEWLLARLGQRAKLPLHERYADARAAEERRAAPRAAYAELQSAMTALERLFQRRFFGTGA